MKTVLARLLSLLCVTQPLVIMADTADSVVRYEQPYIGKFFANNLETQGGKSSVSIVAEVVRKDGRFCLSATNQPYRFMDRANIDRFNLNSSFKELLIILGKPAPLIDAWKDKGLLFRSVRWYLAIKLEKGLEIMSIHAIFAGDDERESMTSLKIERALCKLDGEREW